VEPVSDAGPGELSDPREVVAVGELRQRCDDQHVIVVGPAVGARLGAANRPDPAVGLQEHRLHAGVVGSRRGEVGQLRERRGGLAVAGAVDHPDRQRARRGGRDETQEDAAQQASDPGIAGVGVDGQVAAAEKGCDRGEARVVERMCQTEPKVGRYGGIAGRRGVGHGVEPGAQPAGHEVGGCRAETGGEVVLLGVLLGRCARR
jgi:hypothetical protein